MAKLKLGLVLLICLPWDIVCWATVLFIRLMWGQNLHWKGITLCTELRVDGWPLNRAHWFPWGGWYIGWAGTCFGHGMMLHPAADETTVTHEMVHARQFEASMMRSFMMALLLLKYAPLGVAFCVWLGGYWWKLIPNWAHAWLKSVDVYRGSLHEEHAYAYQEKKHPLR